MHRLLVSDYIYYSQPGWMHAGFYRCCTQGQGHPLANLIPDSSMCNGGAIYRFDGESFTSDAPRACPHVCALLILSLVSFFQRTP